MHPQVCLTLRCASDAVRAALPLMSINHQISSTRDAAARARFVRRTDNVGVTSSVNPIDKIIQIYSGSD